MSSAGVPNFLFSASLIKMGIKSLNQCVFRWNGSKSDFKASQIIMINKIFLLSLSVSVRPGTKWPPEQYWSVVRWLGVAWVNDIMLYLFTIWAHPYCEMLVFQLSSLVQISMSSNQMSDKILITAEWIYKTTVLLSSQ